MKVYLLKEEDFEKLLARVDRNPSHGYDGSSSQVLSEEEQRAHATAHRFFNYHLRVWIEDVKK